MNCFCSTTIVEKHSLLIDYIEIYIDSHSHNINFIYIFKQNEKINMTFHIFSTSCDDDANFVIVRVNLIDDLIIIESSFTKH